MSENLQTRIYTKKPEKDSFFNFQIDWRLLLAFFFILFIIGVVPAIIYSIKYIENNYTMDVNTFNIVYFCNFLLVINYFIFTYRYYIHTFCAADAGSLPLHFAAATACESTAKIAVWASAFQAFLRLQTEHLR